MRLDTLLLHERRSYSKQWCTNAFLTDRTLSSLRRELTFQLLGTVVSSFGSKVNIDQLRFEDPIYQWVSSYKTISWNYSLYQKSLSLRREKERNTDHRVLTTYLYKPFQFTCKALPMLCPGRWLGEPSIALNLLSLMILCNIFNN